MNWATRVGTSVAAFVARAVGADSVALIQELLGRRIETPRLGSSGLLKAYGTSPWLQAIVAKVGGTIAGLEWTVSVVSRGGKAERCHPLLYGKSWAQREAYRLAMTRSKAARKAGVDLRQLDDHELLTILRAGNACLLGTSVIEVTQAHLDLIGEGLWVLDRDGLGTPSAIWPMPPTWMQDIPKPGASTVQINGLGGTQYVPIEDVIYWNRPDPANPYGRGVGYGHALADELETDEFAALYLKGFFKNRARPDLLITGELDQSLVDRLEQKWMEKLRGLERHHRPFFMGGKNITVTDFSKSFADLQMVDLRKFDRDLCLQVYGMPPEIFGILENANRSTIDAADYLFQKHNALPRAERLRQVLQWKLAPLFDERIIVDYVSPLAEDKAHALEVMKGAAWAFTEEEWRAAAGKAPADAGSDDVRMVPFSIVPTRRLGEQADINDEPSEPVSPTPADPTEGEDVEASTRRRVRKAIDDDTINRVLAAVRPQELARRGQPVVRDVVRAFGQSAIDELNIDVTFNVRDPRVIEHLRTWAGDRITTKVNETTLRALRQTLAAGVDAGEATDDLVARIQTVFTEATHARAESIARTEIGRSSNFAALEGFEQADIEQKEWLSTQDSSVRDTHVDLDGTVVGVHEPFVSPSGASGMHPGDFGVPEEDVNCRCGVLAVLTEGKALTAEGRIARWKSLESERAPYDRQLRNALRQGFRAQERAAIAALEADVDDAAA